MLQVRLTWPHKVRRDADPDLGTIRSAAVRKGYKEKEIENIIEELNILNLNKAAGPQEV